MTANWVAQDNRNVFFASSEGQDPSPIRAISEGCRGDSVPAFLLVPGISRTLVLIDPLLQSLPHPHMAFYVCA